MMIAMVGDSDIERWPTDLLPTSNTNDKSLQAIVSGHSGITLPDLMPHVEKILLQQQHQSTSLRDKCLIMIICCGENDIGNEISLRNSEQSLDRILDAIFPGTSDELCMQRYVVSLGPKLEPWLDGDDASRKQYIQMSMTLQQRCVNHRYSHQIFYVDCLLMFCLPETIQLPGALHSGRAIPDTNFFDSDQLHLSVEGYKVWKDIVDTYIEKIINTKHTTDNK